MVNDFVELLQIMIVLQIFYQNNCISEQNN